MVYNGLYASSVCPACDVTAWVKEEQQQPGPCEGPHTEVHVASKRFGKNIQNLKYI